jgi:hypothetical protein
MIFRNVSTIFKKKQKQLNKQLTINKQHTKKNNTISQKYIGTQH